MSLTPALFTCDRPNDTDPGLIQPEHWNDVVDLLEEVFDGAAGARTGTLTGLTLRGAGGGYTPYLFQAVKPGVGNEEAGVTIDGFGNMRMNTSLTISGNPFLELPDFVLGKNSMLSLSSDLAPTDPTMVILTTTVNGGPHLEVYNGTTSAGTLVFQIANNGDIAMSTSAKLGTSRIDIGSNPATFGALRFSNGFAACVRNNGNTADRVLFGYTSNFTDALELGDSAVNMVLMGARVGIGGLSSGFPALKASGATLQVRTGDDGNFTKIEAGTFRATGSDGVTAGPLTTITSITVKGGIITAISGS